MVDVKKEGIMLEKTENTFENEGVFNPAVIREGGNVHMFYRAVRKGNYSTIGYCLLDGPLKVSKRDDKPILFPQLDYEIKGIEDPRIVKIEGTYYMTYTVYDKTNALAAYATSTDLKVWTKHSLLTPQMTFSDFRRLAECNKDINTKYFRDYKFHKLLKKADLKVFVWDKNVMFFPRKINGKYAYLHRIRPGIQLVMINSFDELTPKFWEDYLLNITKNIVMDPKYDHESSYIGGGCPPIETEHGWVLIYHGVQDTPNGYTYNACAALLDLNNPLKELARLNYPLFTPEHNWEQHGIVNNVVFPTGAVLFDDRLYIYYGAADEHIAAASLSFSELVKELLNAKNN